MTYLPQSYPLYAAELYDDGRIEFGLVVAWSTEGSHPDADFELTPVISRVREASSTEHINTSIAQPDARLFMSAAPGVVGKHAKAAAALKETR